MTLGQLLDILTEIHVKYSDDDLDICVWIPDYSLSVEDGSDIQSVQLHLDPVGAKTVTLMINGNT